MTKDRSRLLKSFFELWKKITRVWRNSRRVKYLLSTDMRKEMRYYTKHLLQSYPCTQDSKDMWPRLHEHHNHWWRVLCVWARPGNHHFPNNENPTRALNTTSLKCRLSSMTLLTKGKKFTYAYEGSSSPHASALHWNPSIRLDTFLTDHVFFIFLYNMRKWAEII